MRITHRQLEAYIQFMETGTVTAAAERMRLSQPAMSKILAGLEIDLALTLFQRKRKRLVPTNEAHLLYKEVRRLFAALADVERFAQDLRSLRMGELRIVSAASIGHTLVADALVDFAKANPSVSVSLDVSSVVGTDVLGQNVDVGFSVSQFHHPDLLSYPLFHAGAVCVMTDDHPLATREVIVARDLEGAEFISFTRNSRMRHLTDAVFEQQRVSRKMRAEVFSSVEANALVSRGFGIAIVEPMSVHEGFWPGLVARRFEPAIEFTFNAVLPRGRQVSPLTRAFLQQLRRRIEGLSRGEDPRAAASLSIRLPQRRGRDGYASGAVAPDEEGEAGDPIENEHRDEGDQHADRRDGGKHRRRGILDE
ncbi:LysR family transcriptional regulator [Phreatobacter stygius]|uniref:LysR family transcriptional regulator n=1 Tax=Phreatobacter stygius TaxID=1940610 RepID=A0A4D7B314_9HYPH|nr:LysR family transcriptional regulator [Phreatobacter stygius]